MKVAKEITAEINTNLKKRLKNFFLKLSDRIRSLDDIPAIVIKLKPISWAMNKPKPCVINRRSIKPKYPKSQHK